MKLSHSKLSCILNCPMTYFLQYRMGIQPKQTKAALSTGSAVHWGLEHNTDDLSEYFKEQGTYKQADNYTDDQVLAEAMVHGFLKNKQSIVGQILTHPVTGEKLELVEEVHELFITGKLKSFKSDKPHDFVGIIDLLFLVKDKNGQLYFIVVDYKTSSFTPNWDDYLDQIYRYIFLLNSYVPEVPVLKTGIINLRKTKIRQKANETNFQFRQRLKREYEIDDGEYINWHMYDTDTLDKSAIDNYMLNLSRQADMAEMIDINNCWFINFGAANGKYGKSPYWDIFYKTTNCYVMYTISDSIYDPETGQMLNRRDCRPLDMKVIEPGLKILNKYDKFKAQALAFYSESDDIDKTEFFAHLKSQYDEVDDILLEKYWVTLLHEVETSNEDNG